MDLGGTEEETATISDFDLLKVIGKGSFGKVSSFFSLLWDACVILMCRVF